MPHFLDRYRDAALQRLGRGFGEPGDLDRIGHRACRGRVALDHIDEGTEFGAERVGEPVHEEVVRRTGRELVAGIDIPHGRTLIPAGDHCVVKPVYLQPAVVAAAVIARRRHHPEGASLEGDHDGGGVDVAVLGELRVALDAAGGVDLDGLLPGDPADHVEIVHRAVAEDAAGARDVVHRRRSRVHRGAAHGVQRPQRAAVDRAFGGGECGVEPSLIAHLNRHARACDHLGHPRAFGGGGCDRLLAERRQPALDRGQRQLGMRGCRGRHHHPVHSRRQQRLDRINRLRTVFGRDRGDDLGSLVGDDQTVDAVQPREGVGVEGADPAQSDHAEGGHGILRSSWARSATSSSSALRSSASAASTVSTWLGGARLPMGWSLSRLVGNA